MDIRKYLYLLLIILFFPIGLFVMWIKKPFPKWFQWSITALCLIFVRQIMVLGMIFYGYFLFPEASAALRHYCFGDGSTLHVKSDYIRNSPVVKKTLKSMMVGDKKRVAMRQSEDYRLSYVLNPFNIERQKDKVVITQWMQFDTTGSVKTYFGPIPLPDNIVHVFDCTPYLFYCEFKYGG